MSKNRLSDIERLKKKEQELEKTRKEIELRENIRKAKDFQKKNSDELKNLRARVKKGGAK
jgi:hypothetical protein